MREVWNTQEIGLAVDLYFEMLGKELRGEPFVKADYLRIGTSRSSRSKGSFEFKFGNISSVLIGAGLPSIRGYKAYSNVQTALSEAVLNRVTSSLLKSEPIREGSLAGSLDYEYRRPSNDAEASIDIGFPTLVDLEAYDSIEYYTESVPGRTNVRVESELVTKFDSYLKTQGRQTSRVKIPIQGTRNYLFTDIFDETSGTLWEAKAFSGRGEIRSAIGQLFDYSRYVKKLEPDLKCGIVVPNRPTDDLIDLLESVGFDLAFQQAESWAVWSDCSNQKPRLAQS